MKLLIKNGHLIDPANQTNEVCDILIEGNIIKSISSSLQLNEKIKTIDAAGMIISPGFIDIHVHLREPGQEHKEDIESGSRAAAAGGFTSIACMPNTSPVNDNTDITQKIIQRSREVGLVNIFPVAAISKNLEGKELTHMDDLVKSGAKGFTDDGKCVMNAALFTEALKKAKKYQCPIMEHPEEHSISQDGQINQGLMAEKCNLKGIPAESEDLIIARDIKIQEVENSFLHLTHISTSGAVQLISEAKQKGIKVTADVTPHHLLLNENSIDSGNSCDSNFKMKPPLRSEKDQHALINGLKTGVIDCIATDHAPHSPDEKAMGFEKAPFGVIGMETAFPVTYDRLVRPGIISLERLIETLSTKPAQILRLNEMGRGEVRVGGMADLTILNLEKTFRITAENFQSKSINCPFIGWEGKGVIEYTILGGKIVYQRDTSQ